MDKPHGQLVQGFQSSLNAFESLFKSIRATPSANDMLTQYVQVQCEIQDEIIDFRLKKILNYEKPYLPHLKLDDLSRAGHLNGYSLNELLDYFMKRKRNLFALLRVLPTEKWQRTGLHEHEGHISFAEFMRRMIERDMRIRSYMENQLYCSPTMVNH